MAAKEFPDETLYGELSTLYLCVCKPLAHCVTSVLDTAAVQKQQGSIQPSKLRSAATRNFVALQNTNTGMMLMELAQPFNSLRA